MTPAWYSIDGVTVEHIRDIVVGDGWTRRYRIGPLVAGDSITKAYFTAKATTEADPGLFQKSITTTTSATQGQIEDSGSTSGYATLRFDLQKADTALLTTPTREYDVSVIKGAGATPRTIARGQIVPRASVTDAST